jgi:phosphoglycolate phosphatase-like HAD superfamily hydrolase
MEIEGIIFDLDGTVGDTLPVCYAGFREVFANFLGAQYSDGEIRAMFGPTEEGIIERMIPGRSQEGFTAYLAAYERAHSVCPSPFTGVPELLDSLRDRQIPMAIVTGKGPRSAEISLRVMGLTHYFDIVEAGSAERNVKPANMRKVVETWGLDPKSVLSVGDAPSDIRSARETGLIPVAAAWAPTTDLETLRSLNPAALFDSISAFRDWIMPRLSVGADSRAL